MQNIDLLIEQLTDPARRHLVTGELAALMPAVSELLQSVALGNWTDTRGVRRNNDGQLRTNAVIALRIAGSASQSARNTLRALLFATDTGAPARCEVLGALKELKLEGEDLTAIAQTLGPDWFGWDAAIEAVALITAHGPEAVALARQVAAPQAHKLLDKASSFEQQ